MQHYETVKFFKTTREDQERRDLEKKTALSLIGFSMVEIPVEKWKGDSSSIAASIHAVVPSLFDATIGKPFPQRKHFSFHEKIEGELSNYVMLSEPVPWRSNSKFTSHMWMQEMLDGWRAYFVPHKGFYTGSGKKLHLPQEWVTELSVLNQIFDGELWCGRGKYELTTELLSLASGGEEINKEIASQLYFTIFDVITEKLTFKSRWNMLMSLQGKLPSFANLAPSQKCNTKTQVMQYFNEIKKQGGEGVMIRHGNSVYTPGKTTALAKLADHLTANVKVIHQIGGDQFVTCVQANGNEISVAIPENTDLKQLEIGTIINITHKGISRTLQVYTNPQFRRVRKDLVWNHISM